MTAIQIRKKLISAVSGNLHQSIKRYLVFLVIIAFLGACAQGVPLTKDKVSSLQSVCIDPYIQKPNRIDFTFQQRKKPSSSSWSSILLTAAAEGLEHGSKAVALRRTYESSGISIDSILIEQFETELRQSNIFDSLVASEGQAEFRFQIMKYGFSENYFDRKMRPDLWIKASLVTSDETILWDKKVLCCPSEKGVHAVSQSSLYGNQGLMRQCLREAVKASCLRLIQDMKRDLEGK
jgi:hypothetical protein